MVKIDFREKRVFPWGVFIFFILLGLVISVFVFARKEDEGSQDEDRQDVLEVVTESVEIPDEEEPEDFYVSPDLPKIITIPPISIRGYVQSVGIDQDGSIAVPTNVHLAGWYINSAKPGEVGLSIVTGHRDGATIGGIFRNLGKLKKADKISIEYGDGRVQDFEVVDLKTLSVEEAYDFMYSRVQGVDRQLNLVTCGGEWNEDENTYDDRIIIRAKGV